jgi:hypothetical protein
MIEKVYNWYRNKRKILLDYRLRVMHPKNRTGNTPRTVNTNNVNLEPLKVETTPIENDENIPDDDSILTPKSANSVPSLFIKNAFDFKPDPRVLSYDILSDAANNPDVPFYASDEKKRKAFITNKLKQYSHRNIAKTQKRNPLAMSQPTLPSQNGTVPPTAVATPSSTTSSRVSSAKISAPSSRRGSAGSTTPGRSNTARTSRTTKNTSSGSAKSDAREQNVNKHWLAHRALEAEENLEQIEFKDAVTMWSFNRARIEEEINRRHESMTYASQTGRNGHKIVRHSDLQKEMEERKKKAESDANNSKTVKKNNFLDSSDDDTEEEEPSFNQKVETKLRKKKVVEQEPVIDEKTVFLSPYHTNNRAQIGIEFKDDVRGISDDDDDDLGDDIIQDPEAIEKGFLTPGTHSNSVAALSSRNTGTHKFFLT